VNKIETKKAHCPYCGENIEVLIDCSVQQQNYIEDCQICCRPITYDVAIEQDGYINLYLRHEDE
jgi:hypothetical protein